jgi:hypothetical protein
MADVIDFMKWVDVSGFNAISNKVDIVENGSEEESGARKVRVNLYTQNHRYSITAINKRGRRNSYLGCICYNRASHAGENHIRSCDLHDGTLTQTTWQGIKDDILCRELWCAQIQSYM